MSQYLEDVDLNQQEGESNYDGEAENSILIVWCRLGVSCLPAVTRGVHCALPFLPVVWRYEAMWW